MSDITIIGHRGASSDAPENTLAAIRLGWEQGADGVEIDIRLSRDGQIVLMHDDSTRRTGGVDKKVVEQTCEELRRLDAGAWKDRRFAGERIPTLDEVIATIPRGKQLFIEVKCGPEVIPDLKAALAASGRLADAFVIVAFSYETLRAVRQALPEIPIYWISSFTQDLTGAFGPAAEFLVEQAQRAGFQGLSLDYRGPLDAAFVRKVKAAGLRCYVWTVNDAAAAQRLIADGVQGITTDRPGGLRAELTPGPSHR